MQWIALRYPVRYQMLDTRMLFTSIQQSREIQSLNEVDQKHTLVAEIL